LNVLNVKALAFTAGLLWGGCLALIALVNLTSPEYGRAWLDVVASTYPGYDGPAGLGSVIVVALYGLVDGLICGALFGWVYNAFAGRRAPAA
jgi:hypothetical protein